MKNKLEQKEIFDPQQKMPTEELRPVEFPLAEENEKQITTSKMTDKKEIEVQELVASTQTVSKPLTAMQVFHNNLKAYEKSVLPNLLSKHNIDPAQFIQIVMSEIKKNEKLLQAFKENPSSLFASILAGAEIGLIPSDMLGEFYIIPRNMGGKMTATPQIGYKGLVNILLRSGEISKIHTECVYEEEEFEIIYGLEQNIIHKPNFSVERSANTLKFVYAVAKLKNGEYQFQVLSKGEITKIRALSRYENDLYFNDKKDPQMWMVRKTCLVQLAKLLPKDFYSKKAVQMDSALESGAILSLDEDNNIKLVEAKKVTSTKQNSVINTLNSLPEIPE